MKLKGVGRQFAVFSASIGGYFLYLLAAELLVRYSPPLLYSHHSCETASQYACGLTNAAFFGLAGVFAGAAGAVTSWRNSGALLPTLAALIAGSLFSVFSVSGGESVFVLPFFTNFAGWPSWFTVPVPIIFAGLATLVFIRRVTES